MLRFDHGDLGIIGEVSRIKVSESRYAIAQHGSDESRIVCTFTNHSIIQNKLLPDFKDSSFVTQELEAWP